MSSMQQNNTLKADAKKSKNKSFSGKEVEEMI